MIDANNVQFSFTYTENQVEDIIRCLKTLFTTVEGTQPLDRRFGLSNFYIGKPINVAQSEFTIDVIEKVQTYEPRVNVQAVDFAIDTSNGKLSPIIYLEKGGDEEE